MATAPGRCPALPEVQYPVLGQAEEGGEMKTAVIRARFKYYRAKIANLKAELDDAYYWQGQQEAMASQERKRAEACRRECAERQRQEESDRWYREDQLRSATKDLERARSYGDEWGEARALRKLKSIY